MALDAGIADDHLEAQPERDLAQETRQVAGADDDDAELRPEVGREMPFVQMRHAIAAPVAQLDVASGEIEDAFDAAALLARRQQFVQPAVR